MFFAAFISLFLYYHNPLEISLLKCKRQYFQVHVCLFNFLTPYAQHFKPFGLHGILSSKNQKKNKSSRKKNESYQSIIYFPAHNNLLNIYPCLFELFITFPIYYIPIIYLFCFMFMCELTFIVCMKYTYSSHHPLLPCCTFYR